MQTYIDSVKKEHASYPEQSTQCYKNVVNITVDIYSVIPQFKKKGSEEYCQ